MVRRRHDDDGDDDMKLATLALAALSLGAAAAASAASAHPAAVPAARQLHALFGAHSQRRGLQAARPRRNASAPQPAQLLQGRDGELDARSCESAGEVTCPNGQCCPGGNTCTLDSSGCCSSDQQTCGSSSCYVPTLEICCNDASGTVCGAGDSCAGTDKCCFEGEQLCGEDQCYDPTEQTCCNGGNGGEEGTCLSSETCCSYDCCDDTEDCDGGTCTLRSTPTVTALQTTTITAGPGGSQRKGAQQNMAVSVRLPAWSIVMGLVGGVLVMAC